MKKNQTVQGTFSKLFGKKHASPTATSLYATNPPWIFTREATEEGTRDFDGIYYGDNRFDTVSESGTATLKARPRVRPLLTFLPLNSQENHGLAVPTPSVPEDFAGKDAMGTSALVNGNLRLYSSVGDLRPEHYGLDPLIPPPPPGPAPGPPSDILQPRGESPPPPPPSTAPPPPPMLLEPPPPPPPSMAPPPPPVLGALCPPSPHSSPSTPTPPDFIPPAPPSAVLAPPPPPLPAPTPPAPVSPHVPLGSHLFPAGGITKWKSEVTLNGRQPATPRTSPPGSPAETNGSSLGPKPEPHLTFPRSLKVPPPTPVRTSSIPVQEAQGAPTEGEAFTKKVPSRLPLPSSFHIRPASQAYPNREPEPGSPVELRVAAPTSPKLGQAEAQTNAHAETPPPAPPLPPPAPPLPPPAPPLPPAAPSLTSAKKASPPLAELAKGSKSSSSAPKPTPPSPEDPASSAPVDWRDPSQMEKLRNELAAYLCGSRKDNRLLSHRPGPTGAPPDKEGKKGPSLLDKEAPPSLPDKEASPGLPGKKSPPGVPEKSLCNNNSLPEKEVAARLILPSVDYTHQDCPTPSVRQIRDELEARISSSAEKGAKPSLKSLPPKPLPEGGRIFENGAGKSKFSKPMAKNLPSVSTIPLPSRPFQPQTTSGLATPPNTTPGTATPPKTVLGTAMPPRATPGTATPPRATPGAATPPRATPGTATPPRAAAGAATPPRAIPKTAMPPVAIPQIAIPPEATSGSATPPEATHGPAIPSTATTLSAISCQLMTEKSPVPAEHGEETVESQEPEVPSQLEAKGPPSEASKLPPQGVPSSPALPPKTSSVQEEALYLYKPHSRQKSPSREVAVVMPTPAKGEAAGSGEAVEEKESLGLRAKTPVSAPPADELLRHPVTGEVVERGSPMALLLAARQRAQKGRPGGAVLSRSSLPGSLRCHSSPPEAGSDSIFYSEGRPNSFTVVPRVPKEAKKDPQLALSPRPTVPSQWKPQPCRDPVDTELSPWHNLTKAQPRAPEASERSAPSNLPGGHPLPKSFSSPSSPSYKREEEFSFEIIPPPPEFSNDPDSPAQNLQYPGHRGSQPQNNFPDLRQPLGVGPGASSTLSSRCFPTGGRYTGAGGVERFSPSGRSLIKKRLYVGEPHSSPGPPRGTGRSLSSPNCFGPQPGGPEMRRVNSAGRAPPGGLHTRRIAMEAPRGAPYPGSGGAGEAKHKAPSGDYGFVHGRSPHSTPHYGSPVNTFTVRPGTHHPISYAYSGAHWKAKS